MQGTDQSISNLGGERIAMRRQGHGPGFPGAGLLLSIVAAALTPVSLMLTEVPTCGWSVGWPAVSSA